MLRRQHPNLIIYFPALVIYFFNFLHISCLFNIIQGEMLAQVTHSYQLAKYPGVEHHMTYLA